MLNAVKTNSGAGAKTKKYNNKSVLVELWEQELSNITTS